MEPPAEGDVVGPSPVYGGSPSDSLGGSSSWSGSSDGDGGGKGVTSSEGGSAAASDFDTDAEVREKIEERSGPEPHDTDRMLSSALPEVTGRLHGT